MTKLLKYIGKADIKRVAAVDLAKAGISSPDIVFSQEADFYKSVPDSIAVFLLASGDFQTEDGSTMLDIFENNASPTAAPEVLGVKLGASSDTLDGVVVVPSGGDPDVPALRALGSDAGEALAGNDSRVAGAVQASLVTGENVVFTRDSNGEITGIEIPDGYLLAGSEDGIVAISYAALEVLIDTGGLGFSLSDLADVDLTADVDGYYLAASPDDDKPFTFRPLPTFAGGTGGSVSSAEVYVGYKQPLTDASVDFTSLGAAPVPSVAQCTVYLRGTSSSHEIIFPPVPTKDDVTSGATTMIEFTLILVQASDYATEVVWPAGVLWDGGTEAVITPDPDVADIFTFRPILGVGWTCTGMTQGIPVV